MGSSASRRIAKGTGRPSSSRLPADRVRHRHGVLPRRHVDGNPVDAERRDGLGDVERLGEPGVPVHPESDPEGRGDAVGGQLSKDVEVRDIDRQGTDGLTEAPRPMTLVGRDRGLETTAGASCGVHVQQPDEEVSADVAHVSRQPPRARPRRRAASGR
ncbi:hypothetical protein D0Z08_08385 [Nocardioides immobilis]|uniref:Uncharacterized protein n=1 Tax=Nocardioides immobilis TaxID=2049295 RepID=A0A417Y4Z9_9ACTN|nr:hypothetical protein D0Z08_08385 [Nocardioides immobilis]